jgi:hypothetical protein
MPKAVALAAHTKARLTLPSRPLLYRKEGEARGYFTQTNVAARQTALRQSSEES